MVSSLSQALCGWSCCSGGSPTAVDPFGTHLDLSDDEKWQARALVDAVMPFVPKRVLNAFVECEFNSFASGEPKASPQIPREVEAAVLLIDISGFTKLSEVYSKQGTEGCEEFSLVISDVLARMCDIVERHDGDIDCFAGDAVLVVFEANTESSLSISTGREDSMLDPDSQQSTTSNASPKAVDASQSPATDEPLRRAVDSALRCVFSVASSLNGYETSQDMPPLSLHAALGAGKIFTAECGGSITPRWEAFVAGRAVTDLGIAMPQAGSSELVLTPGAAVHLLDRIQPPVGEPRDHGCVCLQLPAVKDKVASRLKSLVRSWSSLRLTGPRSSRDKEPNAASLMKQQSLAGPLPIGRQITLRMTAPALTAVNKLPSLARQMSGGRPFLPHRLTSMGRLTNAPASFRRKTLNASRASQPPSGAAGVLKSTRNRHAFSDKVFGRLLENDRLIKEAATKQIARRSSRNTWERRGSHVVAEIMNLLPGVTISPHKRLSEDVQRGSDDSGTNTLHLSSRFQSSMTTNLGLVSMSYFGEESYASQQKKYAFSFGLSSLMRFIPSFVSQRCLDNAVLGYMAEVRKVSVLFLVADLQDVDMSVAFVQSLQDVLGKAIDIAEGDHGGATRQITIDEKGLAAIFVFGLPGFAGTVKSNAALRCTIAALELVETMKAREMPCGVGMDSGYCYCGLLGSLGKRCEYAVMGDTVNTAARLAWKAVKQRTRILCTDSIQSSLPRVHLTHRGPQSGRILMEPAGTIKAKGKETETSLYTPTTAGELSVTSDHVDFGLVGMEQETSAVAGFISSCTASSNRSAASGIASGARLLVIQGAVGMGKTALLHHAGSLPSSLGYQKSLTLHIEASASHKPFNICHKILYALLEADMVLDPEEFMCLEAQRIRRVDVKSLPPILQPFANEFSLALEKDPDNRTASFQRLYFDVLLAAMAKRPTLLMIDEAHYCDQLSLTVIAAVAHRMSMHRRNTRKTLSRSASATASSCIILATCGPLHFMAPEWIPSLTDGFFTEVPWGVCISITPLDASGIEGLALRVLGSQGLRSDLLALLQEQTSGIPMHVNELCKWLENNSMLEMDQNGMAGLRKNTHGSTFTPPSLSNIVRTHIDQLSPRLGTVLRHASIMGMTFYEGLLFKLISTELSLTQESLSSHLRALAAAGFLLQMTDEHGYPIQLWKFSQAIYRDVAHGMMLHKRRRKLHREAALVTKDLLDRMGQHENKGASWMPSEWELRAKLAYHWLQLVQGLNKSNIRLHVSEDDLERLAASVSWMLSQHFARGDLKEAMFLQGSLWNCVHPSTLNKSQPWARVQLNLVQLLAGIVLNVQAFDPDGAVLNADGRTKWNDNMKSLLKTLCQTMGLDPATGEPVNSGQLHQQLKATKLKNESWGFVSCTRMAPIMMDFIAAKKVSKPDMMKIESWIDDAGTLEEQLSYVPYLPFLSLASNRFPALAARMQAVYTKYFSAGKPVLQGLWPVQPLTAMVTGCWLGKLMSGEVSNSWAENVVENEQASLDGGQKVVCFGMIRSFEGLWEPQSSRRIDAWRIRVRQVHAEMDESAAHQEWPMLAKQVRFMDAAHEKSELIWQWIVKGAADDPHNSELSSAQQAWAASMERAAMESMKRTWFLDPLVISRNCIHEGCRVIFSPATSYARTSRAMQHLLSVAGILSKCLGHWERAHVGSGADDVSFPAAAIWGRGMLHWFQSCLCAAGALPQAHIEEARLRNGVRGWSRAEALRPGISSVCSSLLMAQAVSMDDRQQPELLAACLPATVALGHLLRGDGLPSSNCSTASASFVQQIATTPSVHVPMHPPLILKDGDSVTVRRVLPGTRQAKDLARNHLRGVMEAINISGSYLAPDKANTLADVGNSETIWEGICLYKSLGPDYELVGGQHPDLLTSID